MFDDIQGGLEFFHGYKFWLGCQKQFYATDKYKGKRLIHWGKPSIWLSNNDPREDKGVDVGWLEGNCDFIPVDLPIFEEVETISRASSVSTHTAAGCS